jgi:hypothetical protein
MIFVAHDNPPKVLQPRKQAFNFPPPFIATKFASVLRSRFFAISFVRRNQFNLKFPQLGIQWVRIVRFIANHHLWSLIGEPLANSFADKFDFMRRSRASVDGDRKTSAVCHCHELRTFAPLGLSEECAPFLAETNVPQVKHSLKSNLPRECKSSASVSRTFRNRPSLTHSWKRRWQVWYGGNLSGKSHHRAPERNIHNTPFKTSRSERRALPRVATTGGLSNNGSIKDHCSLLNSSRRAIREVYQTIFETASSNFYHLGFLTSNQRCFAQNFS